MYVLAAMMRGSSLPMIIIVVIVALGAIFATIVFLLPLTSSIIIGDIVIGAVITSIIIGSASFVHRNFVRRKHQIGTAKYKRQSE
jgi:hypothetical protein